MKILLNLENRLYERIPLEFEITDSKNRKGEKEAININFSKIKTGNVESFDSEKGFGFIKDYHSKEEIFFHYSAIRNSAKRFVRIEEKESILYTEGTNDKGKTAEDIITLESRNHLQQFAEFSDSKQAFIDLKELAEDENWDYIQKPTNGDF